MRLTTAQPEDIGKQSQHSSINTCMFVRCGTGAAVLLRRYIIIGGWRWSVQGPLHGAAHMGTWELDRFFFNYCFQASSQAAEPTSLLCLLVGDRT